MKYNKPMKLSLKLIILPIFFLLQSCSHPVGSAMWHKKAPNADITNYYKEMCLGFGYKTETPELIQCIQTEIGNGMDRADAQVSQMIKSLQNIDRPRNKVKTNCTTWGNDINCTSTY
ncbi:hypothetical protein [Candidatus Thioglobus sp. NP1]|uniref:hypothetical protein n=1 Tax=Candidatus Thioglobus sp. NP1 TaxID=2508687 RepID=UPI000DEDB4FA|nr:hypothetical protein [Candidatus Thioglobus sp. NP1]AXE62028.1 hypothetical protein CRN91_05030 [Candidatus Thioglobus sp. NP1]